MNAMNYDRKILKDRAKASLRGARPRTWKVTLVYWLLVALIPGVINWVLQLTGHGGIFAYFQEISKDPASWSMQLEAMDWGERLDYYQSFFAPAVGAGLISTFVTILMHIFRLVMAYGYANYALKLYRGEPTETANIFSGFPIAGRAIVTGIVVFLFETLWTTAAVILGICAAMIVVVAMAALEGSGLAVGLGVLILVAVWVAVILFSVFVGYRYSLAPYFILTTDMGTMEAIYESKTAMRGNLGRRFVLDLSFLGWMMLNGLIAMGVMFLGYFIIVFAVSFLAISQNAGSMQYMDSAYFESSAYVKEVIGPLMGGMFAGAGILSVVVKVATLPLELWLTAYRGSAHAGFFLTVTGQDESPASKPVSDYIPPQPSDIWDNVPTPPSFTTPASPAPSAPAEEAPGAPEATSGVSETPVEPAVSVSETPVEEATPTEETVPETPAVPEAPAETGAPAEPTATGDEPPKEED